MLVCFFRYNSVLYFTQDIFSNATHYLTRSAIGVCNRSFGTHAMLTPAEPRIFGQPTPETHPHLMKPGELTPGIAALEYELRRAKLMDRLSENSVVISLGYRMRYMSNKVFYPFHQNTDFFYLCGFNEPDSAIVLEKNNSRRGYKMTMFVPPKNRCLEMWEGPRTGVLGAIDFFGADEAMESARFNSKIKDIIKNYKDVYIDLPPRTNILSTDNIQKIKPLSRIIQDLRLTKSDSEIALMRKDGEITGKAFIQTMKFTKPGLSEHDLYAKIDFECRIRGAQSLAYVPVVAGGINALTMHYVRNDMPLRNGDLVLLDAGGEYYGYASDVTRTWPVNGKFTQPQKELYEAVLNVNRRCIKLCTEAEGISLNGIHEISVELMKEELLNIGFDLSEGDIDRVLYPHHVGHYLGLDVHDTPYVDRSRRLSSGMVITIEPGLYVPPNYAYPERYHGMGIRIEDNVVVGATDPIVLSSTAPKEIVDIEFCMSNS
ncbi:peptidase M24 [Gigaspora margarita]|uniref:Peptidase M24 n=2 Tax=Gigaspora margarita TaxID=4874 RepID=A0A8H4A6K9_GIGMA|nr:peptidase M24 [Gigaspora margarita]